MSSYLNKKGREDLENMLTCSICSDLLVNPRQCSKCENNFCQECIEKWMKRSTTCPMRCSVPSFKESRQTNNILSIYESAMPRETIVVIGETGVGKSTLCNLLLRRDEFVAGKGLDLSTTQAKSVELVFNFSRIRVIDTQGFNDSNGRDIDNAKQMITLIKSVKSVKAFLVVLNGQNIRWNEGTLSVINLLNDMFPGFWKNAIFIVNFWSSDPHSELMRKVTGRDEGFLKGEITEKIKSKFGEKPIRIVFLNAADAKLENHPDFQRIVKTRIGDVKKMWSFFNEYETSFLVEKKQQKDELIDRLRKQKMDSERTVKEIEKKTLTAEQKIAEALESAKNAERMRIEAQNELEKLRKNL